MIEFINYINQYNIINSAVILYYYLYILKYKLGTKIPRDIYNPILANAISSMNSTKATVF